MKIVIIGSDGQLGRDVVKEFQKDKKNEIVELSHKDFELSNEKQVYSVLEKIHPNIVINTAAYHNVDLCEINPVIAFKVNSLGPKYLAEASNNQDFYLIHISTDYVFDGSKNRPYIETDSPLPLNVYGNTKLSGEYFIRSISKRHLIMRVSGLYGSNPCRAKGGLNFVQLMIKLGQERDEVRVVDHEFISPTSTKQVAEQLHLISENEIHGLCHATAEGHCSWYQFAKEIFKIKEIKTTLNIAGVDEFPLKTPRPTYSVLDNKVLKENNLNRFKSWQEALHEYLKKNN